jgi:hypothetical protein
MKKRYVLLSIIKWTVFYTGLIAIMALLTTWWVGFIKHFPQIEQY